jgi:hypothetical protein
MGKWCRPLKMNIGLSNLGASSEIEGHCWLTLQDGSPYMEHEYTADKYSIFLGRSKNGIHYWVS